VNLVVVPDFLWDDQLRDTDVLVVGHGGAKKIVFDVKAEVVGTVFGIRDGAVYMDFLRLALRRWVRWDHRGSCVCHHRRSCERGGFRFFVAEYCIQNSHMRPCVRGERLIFW
jgi:hypothetical protein